MRILTGKYRGRVFKMPMGIRPTQGKVRKAVFDILGDIQGLSFLELFAGSGAVGFEAASRGVGLLALVEQDSHCRLAIKETADSLKLDNYELYQKNADEAVRDFHKNGRKFDIVFLDPPYRAGLSKKTLQTLSAYDILAPCGLILAQHFKKDLLPERVGDLVLSRKSAYGDTVLSFYQKHVPESDISRQL